MGFRYSDLFRISRFGFRISCEGRIRRPAEGEKQGQAKCITGVTGPWTDQAASMLGGRRPGTDGLFASVHPFGSLAATTPTAARATVPGGEGPWLCVAVFRRVCPFEDERRWVQARRIGLPRRTATKAGGSACYPTVGRVVGRVKSDSQYRVACAACREPERRERCIPGLRRVAPLS